MPPSASPVSASSVDPSRQLHRGVVRQGGLERLGEQGARVGAAHEADERAAALGHRAHGCARAVQRLDDEEGCRAGGLGRGGLAEHDLPGVAGLLGGGEPHAVAHQVEAEEGPVGLEDRDDRQHRVVEGSGRGGGGAVGAAVDDGSAQLDLEREPGRRRHDGFEGQGLERRGAEHLGRERLEHHHVDRPSCGHDPSGAGHPGLGDVDRPLDLVDHLLGDGHVLLVRGVCPLPPARRGRCRRRRARRGRSAASGRGGTPRTATSRRAHRRRLSPRSCCSHRSPHRPHGACQVVTRRGVVFSGRPRAGRGGATPARPPRRSPPSRAPPARPAPP